MTLQQPRIRSLASGALALLTAAFMSTAPARAATNSVSPITTEAQEAFWWGDIDALERTNQRLRQGSHLSPEATSELELFRIGLGQVINAGVKRDEPYLAELEALTLQWTKAKPASALAHVLYARVLLAHGWSYRGNGYIKDVPPESLAQFTAYLTRATDHLRSHADVVFTDSYAHATLLEIGKALGWESAQMLAIVEDGLKRNPDDINLYFDMVDALVPKWGGDAKTLDDYIGAVVEKTRAEYGTGMYARLYGQAADAEYGHRLFQDSHADWAKMKQSYEDMLVRFPDSPIRRNRYAHMACIAGDKATLLALLDELGPRLDATVWGDNGERTLEGCQRLARSL